MLVWIRFRMKRSRLSNQQYDLIRRLQFRWEMFNAFNHPSFGNPGTTLGGSNFGVIDNSTGMAVAPRSGQLSARVTF